MRSWDEIDQSRREISMARQKSFGLDLVARKPFEVTVHVNLSFR